MAWYSKRTIFTVAFALALGSFSIASAQVVQPGARMAQGWVVSVRPGNGQGMFRIRTGTGNNQLAAGVNRAGGGAMQQFVVGPATQFDAVSGSRRAAASFASLRPGQRVMVQAQGQQAIGVRILVRNQYAGAVRRPYYSGRGQVPRTLSGHRSTMRLTSTQRATRAIQPIAVSSNQNRGHSVRMTGATGHAMGKRR